MDCNELDVIDYLNKTSYSIADLLPQDNLALVRDSKVAFEMLKMLYKVINLLAECLGKFYITKQYQYFDPHVGENACQIRAYAFFILSKRKDHNAVIERIHFLNIILEKLREILSMQFNYKNNSYTVVEFIKKYECYFSVEWDECFLCKAYFLTLFRKVSGEATYTCSYTLANFFKISRTASEKMIHQYQLHLARMTCEFIKAIAWDLNIKENSNSSIISSVLIDDDKRMVYPCFFSSKLIFLHMQKMGCPVLIILKTTTDNDSRTDLILYDGKATQGHLLAKNNTPIKNDTCVVMMCPRVAAQSLLSLELLKKLNNYGLYNILLMNMAAHPQLSGLKLAPFAQQFAPDTIELTTTEKEIEKEFFIFKSKAHKDGFCKENPSLLWTKHAFIDTVSNQIYLHQNTKDTISVRENVDI